MKKFAFAGLLTLIAATVSTNVSYGFDHHDREHYNGYGHDEWHGDIHHFREYDFDRWRGGRWYNGFHDGRVGWWWMVGGGWYFYPTPVYPYPDPYRPPAVALPPNAPAPQYWYCGNPAGYYPYVAQCGMQWQPIYANQQAVAQPPIMAAPQSTGGMRDMDDRQLNHFAAELGSIKSRQRSDLDHINDLRGRVAAFHQVLFQRGYGAMDILQDTERLERRIASKQAKLNKKFGYVTPAPSYTQYAPALGQDIQAGSPPPPPPGNYYPPAQQQPNYGVPPQR